ncbi:hypothetical protein PROFUN_16189, partial [Planoprotostelium fungivorum]
ACCGPYVIAGLGGNLNTRVHVDKVLAPFTTVPTMIDKKRMEGLLSSDLGSKFYGPDTLVKDYPSLFQSGGTYDDVVVGALKTALDTPLRRHEDSEMVWGSFWDRMFLDLWTCLKSIVFERNELVIARNQEDETMTKQRVRRDFYGYCRDFLLVVGEDKSCGESLGAAEKDLKDKNNTFATSGSSIQFYQMDNQSTPELISVTSTLNASFLGTRVNIIKVGLNVMRWMRTVLRGQVIKRDNSTISFHKDYVKKAVDVCDESQLLRLIKLYTKLDLVCSIKATQAYWNGRKVDEEIKFQGWGDLVLHLTPMAMHRMPRSVDDANQCVTDVLAFLASFHSLGYVHLSGEQPPKGAKSIPPDAFHHDGFTYQHDLQMFGNMLGEIGEELSNSAAYKFGVFLQKKGLGHYKNITNAVNGWRFSKLAVGVFRQEKRVHKVCFGKPRENASTQGTLMLFSALQSLLKAL